MPLTYPTKKSNAERQKKINAKIKEIDKKRNDQIKKLNAQNEKFLKESRSKGYLSKKYQTPTELKASKKRTQKLDAQTADEVGSKKMKPVSKKAKDDYKFDQLIESLTGKKGKGKVMKKKMGGGKVMKKNMGGKVVRKDAEKFLEDLEKSDSYKEATKRHARNEKKLRALAEKKKQDFLDHAKKVGGKASVRQGRPRAAVRNIKASDVDKKRSARIASKKAEATRAKNNPKKKSPSTKLPVNLFPDGLPYESYKKESMINAKGGGKVEYKMGGGKVMSYKKGGPITYRMSGGQVVDNSYD